MGLLVVEGDGCAGVYILDKFCALGATTARVDHDKQMELDFDAGVGVVAGLQEFGLNLLLHSDWFLALN